jgi:hypothetical protein
MSECAASLAQCYLKCSSKEFVVRKIYYFFIRPSQSKLFSFAYTHMALLEKHRLAKAVRVALQYLTKDNISYMSSIVGMRGTERDRFLENPYGDALLYWTLHFSGNERAGLRVLFSLLAAFGVGGFIAVIRDEVYGAESLEALCMPPASSVTLNATDPVRGQMLNAFGLLSMVRLPSDADVLPLARHIGMPEADAADRPKIFERLMSMPTLPDEILASLALARNRAEFKPVALPARGPTRITSVQLNIVAVRTLRHATSAERGTVADVLGMSDRRHRLAAPDSSDAEMVEIWTECFPDAEGTPDSYKTPAHGLAVLFDVIRALGKKETPSKTPIAAILQATGVPADLCLPSAGLIYRARCCALAIIVRLTEDERSAFADITLARPVSAADMFGRFARYMTGVGWREALERIARAAERSACGLEEYARAARALIAEPDSAPPAAPPASTVCALERIARAAERSACGLEEHARAAMECSRSGQELARLAAAVAQFADAHNIAMVRGHSGQDCRDAYMQSDAVELVQVTAASSSSSARADCAADYSLPPRVAVASSSPAAAATAGALALIDEARAAKNDTGVDALDCPLCMDYRNNVALSCGHTVCVLCFNQSYGGKTAPLCATCRGPVTSYLILYN